ncbi:NAD(P)-dependent oxidoreductase [Providencia sp. PROV188]|uniref:NAD-dependent epimerase/dehydratase family protein n=1 Tax=Providencia sp. PROV188 TaxID=2939731 RepID=UPI0022DD74DF|nr:NAD(P)-dependent oxidoreductase [Providencia sp. PROV188]WBM60744.1 NAD(P)-dependent oxidoreductase [Providencia sp. PROV188]
MKILVTGASGFIGSQFCKYHSSVFEPIALVRNSSLPIENTRYYDGSYDSLCQALEDIDIVLHLATYYTAEHKPDDIHKIIDANISFGAHLLEAMKERKVKKLINIGTTWQYYMGDDHRYANLYAASKQAFQEFVNWYVDSQGFSVINLHLNDTYGEEDTRKKLLQLLIECAVTGRALDMSPGEQQFETCYIRDVIQGIEIALEIINDSPSHYNETYSLLSGNNHTLKKLVSIVESITNEKISIHWGARPYRNREVMEIPYNCYKILPGWQPKISIYDGIEILFKKYKV